MLDVVLAVSPPRTQVRFRRCEIAEQAWAMKAAVCGAKDRFPAACESNEPSQRGGHERARFTLVVVVDVMSLSQEDMHFNGARRAAQHSS